MNKSHRLSQGAKKVTPPIIPSFNPRGSGSSFGSDCLYGKEESAFSRDTSFSGAFNQRNNPTKVSAKSKHLAARGKVQESAVVHAMDDPGIDLTMSPGRDSPGDDSSASICTVESSSISSGYRNSTTSLDSGRASNSNSTATTDLSFHTIQPIHEHRAMVKIHHQPGSAAATPPNRFQQFNNSISSFRQSYHSSTSSLGSTDRAEDTICALNISEMLANGVEDQEILLAWLTDLHYEEYYDLFTTSGYDMPTISRMTPEDLTAIGIKKPNHRKRLKAEIARLNIPDGIPNYIPNTLDEWLCQIRLSDYRDELQSQGYLTIDDVAQISIEDLEDVGLYKLGHQKRFVLAIKRIKDLKAGRRIQNIGQSAILDNRGQGGKASSTFHQSAMPPSHPPSVRKPPQSPGSCSVFSSFQRSSSSCSSNSVSNNPPHPLTAALVTSVESSQGPTSPSQRSAHHGKPVYEPEVIRIERSATVRPLQDDGRGAASPQPPSPPGMPQPMPPLNSAYARFQTQGRYFQEPPRAASIRTDSRRPWGTSSMVRSFDDGDIMLNGGMETAEYRVQNRGDVPYTAAMISNSGGGTLPRPKGLVKPRPVAKITANPQQPAPLVLENDDGLCKDPPIFPNNVLSSCDNSENFVGEQGEAFPFANDNVGTIRVRSNLHASQMSRDPFVNQRDAFSSSGMIPLDGAAGQVQAKRVNGGSGQRTAGDVLNDIGSMLADLTDELDAMLHLERDPNKP